MVNSFINDLAKDILGGGIDLKIYDTIPQHAKEYGLESINPLFMQIICVSEPQKLKELYGKVLASIENYAIENGHDLFFGHITQPTQHGTQRFDAIKNWLCSNGYAINNSNNDFHKFLAIN